MGRKTMCISEWLVRIYVGSKRVDEAYEMRIQCFCEVIENTRIIHL